MKIRERNIKIPDGAESAIADGFAYGSLIFGIPLILGLSYQTYFNPTIKGMESLLQGKEFVMKDVNEDGKLDMISSKKGIYLHKKDWCYEKIENLNKFFKERK